MTDTANGSIAGSTFYWTSAEEVGPNPARDLFTVEVHGLHRIDLIPKNDLARSLLAAMLHADIQCSAEYRAKEGRWGKNGEGMQRATLNLKYSPMFSRGDDVFWTGRRLNAEQVAAVEKVLNPPAKKRRRPVKGKKK